MGDRRGHEVDGRRQVRRSLESWQVRQDHTESIVAGGLKLLARHQLSQLRQARLVDTGVKTAIIDDPTEEGVRSAQAGEQGRRPPGELADPGHLLDGPEGSQAFDEALLPTLLRSQALRDRIGHHEPQGHPGTVASAHSRTPSGSTLMTVW